MCGKQECDVSAMVPALTLHGMWPSYATPVDGNAAAENEIDVPTPRRSLREEASVAAGGGKCFWPQMCTKPGWFPKSSPWTYDPSLLPKGPQYEALAPAWYSDGLGSHEWPKHGTCAAWADGTGTTKGLDQKDHDAMFALAKAEGTPNALVDAMGGSLPLKELQDLFGGAKRVALWVHSWVRARAGSHVLRPGGGNGREPGGTGRARGLPVHGREGQPLR